MVNPKAIIAKHTTEAEFQRDLIAYAKEHGWFVHGERPGRTMKGWATAIQGHEGFPDLVLARTKPGCHSELVIAELKSEKGILSRAQREWLQVLADSLGADVKLWRPSDWDEICRILE